MKKNLRPISAAVIMMTAFASQAKADLTQILDQLPSDVERQSAIALQATYNDLIKNASCFDEMQGPAVSDVATGNIVSARAVCDGQTYKLFSIARSFVHTANSLSDSGSTTYGLGLDIKALGNALHWTADEEYSAQGSVSNNYARSQTNSLTARLNALRMGAHGFSLGFNDAGASDVADNAGLVIGGGASSETYSPWGGFLNVSIGKGDKSATSLEDAFEMNGNQYTAGVDYRVNDRWTVGALTNYIDQTVDFDKAKSIVDGNIDTTGYDFSPFVMFTKNNFYVSGSVAYQKINFDSVRGIHYISNNPMTPSVNTRTFASASGTNTSYFVGAGYNYAPSQFSIEPFVNYSSVHSTIDAFTERDASDSAFDVAVNSQHNHQDSFNIGATARYTFTPKAAVITPYVTVEMAQLQNVKGTVIESHYVNATSSANTLSIPTDNVDKSYMVNTIGFSSVLIGSHQSKVGGDLAGGLQIFAQYKQITGLKHYSADEYMLGLRYEF